jgi:hypothetical protein
MTRVTCKQRQFHSNLTSAVAVPAAHPFPSAVFLRVGFVSHSSKLVVVGGGYGF